MSRVIADGLSVKARADLNLSDELFTNALKNKLDAIEANATADQTKADIDSLNIDANTLGSVSNSQFVRTDQDSTITAKHTISGIGELLVLGDGSLDNADAWIRIGNGSDVSDLNWLIKYQGSTSDNDGNELQLISHSTGHGFQLDHLGNIETVGNGVWTGDGSGLTGTASIRATGTTKADVGLGSVDNFSRADDDARYLGITANAVTASDLDSINTTFSGTYPVAFNVNGTIYSNTAITYSGVTGLLTAPNFSGDGSGLTGTASLRATGTTKADVGLGSVDNYSRGDYDARYLAIGAKAADSNKLDGVNSTQFLRSDTTDYLTGKLRLRGDIENEDNYRDHGVYGYHDSQKTNHIWSMGSQYRVPANGSNFGDLYGLAYKHTDNSTGGAMAGGHQMVWCADGTPRAAMGDGIWTSGNVTAYSDIRVKTNINVIPEAIAKVKQLSGYTYERTDIKDDMTGEAVKQTGVIAQEVIKVLPEAVTGGPTENNPEGHYSVAYGNMVGLLIESIKEQQIQIDELKRRIG